LAAFAVVSMHASDGNDMLPPVGMWRLMIRA
jgi:hypothetical protein